MKNFDRVSIVTLGILGLLGCADLSTSSLEQHKTMQIAPYGSWASPISASLAAESSKGLAAIALDGKDLFWLETRPLEGGRSVLMRADGSKDGLQITPDGMNVRTRVHEYGGASFLVHRGSVFFSNFADQGLYAQEASSGAAATRISKDDNLRFADCEMDERRNRLICIREDHRADGEASNSLVAIDLGVTDTGGQTNGQILWGDSDFVAYPRVSPSGDQLAWISWDHPNMPWDNVALWVADINPAGELSGVRRLNPDVDESIMQPTWAEDGTLYLLSDRSGWWNLHRWADDQLAPVHSMAADLGGPLWGLGAKFFALISNTAALVEYNGKDGSHLAILSLEDGTTTEMDLPFTGYGSLNSINGKAFVLTGRADQPGALVEIDLEQGDHQVLVEAGGSNLAAKYVSFGQAITFPTANNQQAHAFYYPPANGDYAAPEGELPPLVVLMHGGPTAATGNSFSIAKQFWTSRGIAIIDVNYRGSTGYGRDYRQQLNGQWGVVDLEDAVAATQYLVGQDLADPERLLIRGGSAGGFTTLSALAFTDVFAAGANYFGVADLEALAKDTHKFESRYLDSMVGPYPEMQKLYRERSPIHALEGFNAPLITFQGSEDRIVPPEQSRMIYAALRDKGTATAYIEFPGEQHGFRKAENNVVALESELYFYGKVLGFEPSGELPEVEIDNLNQ